MTIKGVAEATLFFMEVDMYNIQKLDNINAAYIYYTEYHMSLRDIAEELEVSRMTVKRYLEALEYISDDMYVTYEREKKKRKGGRKRGS